jgi:hypothetical protein
MHSTKQQKEIHANIQHKQGIGIKLFKYRI